MSAAPQLNGPAIEQAQTNTLPPMRGGEVSLDILKYKEELAAKMGLPSPYGMGLMKELAADMVASGMVPKHFANNPMGVYMAALRGREMELEPMESVMETFWSAPGGNLGMYARKQLQLLHRGGVTSKFLREDAEECQILFTPPPPHEPYTAVFNISEAQNAGLDKPDSNWRKWRTDMNRARAISRGYRALLGTFGKLSTFGGYTKEEMEDTGMVDSATGEATEADRKRAEILDQKENQGMGSFKVGLKVVPKPVPAEQPAPEPVTVDVKPEPVAETKPEPVIQYWIQMIMKTGSGEVKHIPVEEPPQVHRDVQVLRARALANANGATYVVVKTVDGKGTEEVAICNAPEHSNRINRVPPPEPPQQTAIADAPETAKAPAAPVAAETPNPQKEDLKARLTALAPLLTDEKGKPIATRTAAARFNSFFAGFLGVSMKDLPKDPAQYSEAINQLETILNRDVDEFRAGPEQCGKRSKDRYTALTQYVATQWKNPETAALAIRLCTQWGLEPEPFRKYVEFNGLDFLPVADGHAFLRVVLRTREAGRLLKIAKEHNLTIAGIVKQIEDRALQCPVEQADPKTIESAILGFIAAVRDEVTRQAPKPEPPKAAAPLEPEPEAPPEPVEEDTPGLWSDL